MIILNHNLKSSGLRGSADSNCSRISPGLSYENCRPIKGSRGSRGSADMFFSENVLKLSPSLARKGWKSFGSNCLLMQQWLGRY